MSDFNIKNNKGMVVHSISLPYFNNKKVHLNTLEFGKIIIDEHKFTDLTKEGGRFHQWYTYKIKIK